VVNNNHGDGKSPLRIGLWDPFQMTKLHGISMEGVDPITTLRPSWEPILHVTWCFTPPTWGNVPISVGFSGTWNDPPRRVKGADPQIGRS